MMTIFAFNAVSHNANFAAGIVAPIVTEAVRTKDDEPTDADRIAHYFRDEIASFDRDLEHRANLAEFAASYERGYIHA